jgi:hypothetical protein
MCFITLPPWSTLETKNRGLVGHFIGIANHSAASQLFGDRISAPCPRHAVAPRRAQKRPPGCQTGCVFNGHIRIALSLVLHLKRKGKNKLITWVCANSARARIARFTRAIPRSASPASHDLYTKFSLSKFHHGPKLWASQSIFDHFWFCPNMAIS